MIEAIKKVEKVIIFSLVIMMSLVVQLATIELGDHHQRHFHPADFSSLNQ